MNESPTLADGGGGGAKKNAAPSKGNIAKRKKQIPVVYYTINDTIRPLPQILKTHVNRRRGCRRRRRCESCGGNKTLAVFSSLHPKFACMCSKQNNTPHPWKKARACFCSDWPSVFQTQRQPSNRRWVRRGGVVKALRNGAHTGGIVGELR